ncbi:MAG TPA: hypothetical protein VFT72_04380 [Opitutaceae bacterium]|nr:hypothetical protein [Opitutaceae bacterium]
MHSASLPRSISLLLGLVAILFWISVARATTPEFAGYDRFLQVKEWDGVLATHAESSGSRESSGTFTTYSSAIFVQGRFHLEPHFDKRGKKQIGWKGKGEAAVRVNGKRRDVKRDSTVNYTYAGDYIDRFTVIIDTLDLAKGTYQMMVLIDDAQEQPHHGHAIHVHSVSVSSGGTTVSDGIMSGHGWANDAGAGFSRQSNFPKTSFIVNGTMMSKNDDFLSVNGGHWATNWSLKPVGEEFEDPLKAVAGGPYTVERGGNVNLDGFLSTGKIKSYRWTFEPMDTKSGIPFAANAVKNERRVPLTVLAPVRATLTVSDGEKEDSDSAIINVTPRDFETMFVHRTQEQLHPRSIPPRHVAGHDMVFAGGENVCAFETYGGNDTIHILHPGAVGGSWDDRGYILKQVHDAGGPFDGIWYIDSYKLRIERQVLINKYILPNGPAPVRTTTPFYETNKQMGNAVDDYLKAVRRHELLHSELMEKSLKAQEPGRKIEAFAAKNKEELKAKTDQIIQSAEDTIEKASADPLPSVGFKGNVAFPDDATDKYGNFEMSI